MRSFLLASAALCLTWGLSGCDTTTTEKPATPPAANPAPAPAPAPAENKDKMEPAPATTPTPAPAPTEPKPEPPK